MKSNEREKIEYIFLYKDSRKKKRDTDSCKGISLCENSKADSLSASIIKIFRGKIVDESDYQDSSEYFCNKILFG